jgi:hypothetical protein
MYGSVTVSLEDGKLVMRRGPSFTGALEHWHYDVFRVTWNDRQLGRQNIIFRLDSRGQVADLTVENLDVFTRATK